MEILFGLFVLWLYYRPTKDQVTREEDQVDEYLAKKGWTRKVPRRDAHLRTPGSRT